MTWIILGIIALMLMPFMGCVAVPYLDETECPESEGGSTGTLEIIAMDDLGAQPALTADTHTIATDWPLVDAANAGWSQWRILEDTLTFSEEPTDSGRVTINVAGTIVGDDATKRYILAKMNAGCCKFAVGITSNDGITYVIPNVRFRRNFTLGLGGTNDDRVEYTLAISKVGKPAYIYTGAFLRLTA